TLGSKLLGFFRETLIAVKFGSGIETDTYFIAMSATGIATALISRTIATTSIPILSDIEVKEGKKGKISHTNNVINIILCISIIMVLVTVLGAPLIVRILASGFKDQQFDLAVNLTRVGSPMILFSGIIGVMTGYLQSEERFNATAMIGIPFNLVYIFF